MTRKNYKKLIFKVEFLREDHKDCKEVYDKAHSDFMSTVRKLHSELNVYDEELDAQPPSNTDDADSCENPSDEEEDLDDEKSNDHPSWAKSLYRKIALKTHPDRLMGVSDLDEKETLVELYERTVTAYDDEDYGDLIAIAMELKLNLPDEDDVHVILEKKAKSYSEKITKMKSSLYWMWYHSSEEDKKLILSNFMKMRGWTGKRSGVRKSRHKNHPGKSIAWARKKVTPSGSLD